VNIGYIKSESIVAEMRRQAGEISFQLAVEKAPNFLNLEKLEETVY